MFLAVLKNKVGLKMKYKVLIFSIFIILFVLTNSYAEGPQEELKLYIDKTIEVFKQYDTEKNSSEYNREFKCKLIDLADEIFAFNVMSRMVLGYNWNKLSKQEQDEFVCLFIGLLSQDYFDKILEHVNDVKEYNKENIEILQEKFFTSTKAEINTRIKYQDKFIPIDYRFLYYQNKWQIYDVIIEGVSLIKNYRSQFKDMFLKQSVKDILKNLREKVQDSSCIKGCNMN